MARSFFFSRPFVVALAFAVVALLVALMAPTPAFAGRAMAGVDEAGKRAFIFI
jgi:hypothetical protein